MRCEHVEIWCAATNVAVEIGTLSPDERLRASRFRFEHDRSRWMAARVLLRRALGEYLGTAPANLTFAQTDFGKPMLDGSKLPFNLSHSGNLAVCAIAENSDVGIDIELIRPVDDIAVLFRSISSAREQASFDALAPEQKTRAFFETWTAKEACVKATGAGLTTPLHEIEVLIPRGASLCITSGFDGWSVFPLCLHQDYAGTLALRTPGQFPEARISLRWLRLERS
jgi:4'-phosphopantetheinyl transferase